MHRLCTTKCASISNLSLVLGGRRHRENVLIAAQSRNSASSGWYPGGKLLGSVNFQPVALGAAQKSVLDAKGVNLCSCIALAQQRQQSTTTTNAEQQPLELAKKKSKKRPKYVELLEVTDTSSTQSMTRVQRINAKTIQKLIKIRRMAIMEKQKKHVELEEKRLEREVKRKRKMQPIEYRELDIEAQVDSSIIASGQYDDRPMIFCNDRVENVRYFDDPKEVANILKSFQNFRSIIESIEHEKEETMEAENLLPALDIRKDVQDNTMDSTEPYLKIDVAEEHEKVVNEAAVVTKSKSRYKSKTHICEEQERQAKITALRTHLNSYLNICTSAGLVNRAQTIIIAYRSRAVRNKRQSPITIQLYNILLHGLAEKSLFERFQAVFDMIKEDDLKFNEQTFAAIFECLGRMEVTEENNAKVEEFIKMAEEESLTLHQIMNNSKFVRDQREMVLQAIRRVQPNFSPVYVPPLLGYDNLLLNHLNENVPSIGDEPVPKQTEHPLPGSQIMHPKYGYTKEDLLERAREQMELELKGSITIKSIEKSKTYANAYFCRQRLKEVEAIWRKQIHDAVIRDMNSFKAQIHSKPNGYMNYFTYLRSVDAKNFVDILMKEILNIAGASETYSATVSQLYKDLGMQVYRRHQLDQKQKTGVQEKLSHIYADYCTWWDEGTNMETSDNTRQLWQRLVHNERKSGPSMDLPDLAWPQSVLYGVGRFLYNILVRDIKIDSQVMRKGVQSKPQNLIPAFYTLYRNKGRLVREEIKPHPLLARLVRASQQQTLTFDTNLVPMLCPPQPWSTQNNGGYLLTPSDLIRLPHQAVLQLQRINTSNPQHLYPALDSLNQLASIPWRVNTDVLDVIIEVFQNGGDPKVDVPQPPASLPALPEIETHDSSKSKAQLSKLFKDKLARRRKQAEMFSLWCDALYRLSLANHYRDKVFWLPHNMDFRGRVYPLPPHLNHLGSDMARSMLIFDKAQPLGPDGFNWLKLHCINLTGLMKREPVEIRLAYADRIMDDILDSADRPLTGRKWWAKSDEPWQTLACCQEIAKVQRAEDKEAYLCRFPIHQDGSCNGLQHYAALGRDKAGGFSVNLSPCEKPQDVYSAVVALVEKSRKVDAENNILVAQALDGFVQRKVIKQTVMTTVYGVTRFGARLQIARQLKDNDNFPKEYVWPASTYLTTKTFESLREMFSSAREIQDWFTDCARYISSVRGKHVEWVTPLGLPIVQPYNRTEVYSKTASSPRIRETISMDMFERPNVMKQKNAFPPNFIHSLDSSHMMLTSLHCERKGMTFVSVHDCFWTHACTVPDMNKICREQFVALHSQPIIEDLSKFLKDRYSFGPSELQNDNTKEEMSKLKLNQVLRSLPEKGDFDLNSVLNSTYFFS